MELRMYQVVEMVNGKHETYMIGFETEEKMNDYINGRRLWINEKKDSIVAWSITKEGYGYIDLEKYWNLYSKKVA